MRSIREVCIKDHGEDEVRGWGNRPLGDRWTEAIARGDVLVVADGDRILGHGYSRAKPAEGGGREAHIYGLYLLPEALGQGWGGKLAGLLLERARAAGARRITLDSTLTAHDFYRRLGFVDAGPMETAEIGGTAVRYFPMALALD